MAPWKTPFEKNQIVNDFPFIKPDGKQITSALSDTGDYCYTDCGSYQVLSLDYGNTGYAYYIVLPIVDMSVGDLPGILARGGWYDSLTGLQRTRVHFVIPKFEAEGSYNLVSALQSLGVRLAFTGEADFSSMMTDSDVYVSQVLHKVKFSLDEKGTEAAAATLVKIGATDAPGDDEPAKPVEFIANRPFVYAIAERSSGAILFAGIYDGS